MQKTATHSAKPFKSESALAYVRVFPYHGAKWRITCSSRAIFGKRKREIIAADKQREGNSYCTTYLGQYLGMFDFVLGDPPKSDSRMYAFQVCNRRGLEAPCCAVLRTRNLKYLPRWTFNLFFPFSVARLPESGGNYRKHCGDRPKKSTDALPPAPGNC